MKRIVKKNQIILTLLAVMIAVAGYLSYAGKIQFPGGEKQAQADVGEEETVAAGLLEISDEDILKENHLSLCNFSYSDPFSKQELSIVIKRARCVTCCRKCFAWHS